MAEVIATLFVAAVTWAFPVWISHTVAREVERERRARRTP